MSSTAGYRRGRYSAKVALKFRIEFRGRRNSAKGIDPVPVLSISADRVWWTRGHCTRIKASINKIDARNEFHPQCPAWREILCRLGVVDSSEVVAWPQCWASCDVSTDLSSPRGISKKY